MTEINESLIRQYHETGNIEGLITIFDLYRRATLRAEGLSQAYLNQMSVLEDRLKNAREATHTIGSINNRLPGAQPATGSSAKPKVPKPDPPKQNLVVDIDLGD